MKIWIKHWLFFNNNNKLSVRDHVLPRCIGALQTFLYLLLCSVTVGWLEEEVPYDTSHHSNSVKKNWKVLPRSLESADHIMVVRGGDSPLEYARSAGKIEEKIGGGVHYRPTRYLGGDDRCHATNLLEAGDSCDVCYVIPFMWARPVRWQ